RSAASTRRTGRSTSGTGSHGPASAIRSTSPATPRPASPPASPPPGCRWDCRSSAGAMPTSRCCKPPRRSSRRVRGPSAVRSTRGAARATPLLEPCAGQVDVVLEVVELLHVLERQTRASRDLAFDHVQALDLAVDDVGRQRLEAQRQIAQRLIPAPDGPTHGAV